MSQIVVTREVAVPGARVELHSLKHDPTQMILGAVLTTYGKQLEEVVARRVARIRGVALMSLALAAVAFVVSLLRYL